ncbi:MAG: threonine--tRNA ligase [Candidatus Staskawiczbacteria bacterium RIFOXYC1_FULL_37_43]|nr:MAG: threonine--tRNA ligase [Candidatus Staskawiczbacteria bacterium RIFCSPHIGHO2_01_FULL_37_17]OGZ72153.1 MAG: threonine--tRNA ligase [Candidatus Staskawiczbacteria bacterium RIFCSPLOWO2_01_FULL_37_19]OGZ75478.1 MAG: threonine--tRNA ligase [Candidatus Staskawiczbacteria bacterium RIFOXYA1_FULL_37_15]OGZ80466.1 MAG: threonine--tRNA ligase [Candidatus Staskawiczbacteria bacterium RIFOXYB1_FULL_38_37]OGZ81256.1 MAG: threonine--tRNA ligase [Candidatus Staskawiczbacteria bacterium RIFOXYB2_FULL_
MAENIENIRHSLSHIMAQAVLELHPKAKLGMGPAIENGFYYDFLLPAQAISEGGQDEFIKKVEARMKELILQDQKFIKKDITKLAAKKLFKDQPYKLELIKELPGKNVSVYITTIVLKDVRHPTSGGMSDIPPAFTDLCKGPHVKNTSEINPKAFKLTRIAGAYWKSSEKNKMLTRIYGLAFTTEKELSDYVKMQEEAEKRDHRVLGKKLDLFIFSDIVGKGLPLYTEKGTAIRRELERLIVDEEIKRGYKHVCTPDLAKVDLFKKSGHYPYYKDTMYPVMKVDEEELILRPMTCPHHYQLYLAKPRSYRELPFRIAELAKQYRYEKSGELTGLARVRCFCLADSHIICQKDQAEKEINLALKLIEDMAGIFELKSGVDYRYRLSLGDKRDSKKYYKDDRAWDFAENILRKVLKEKNAPFFEAENEAAFYGPKIDIQMKNFSGKEDTAFTVQYDFVGPKRFNLVYTDSDGKEKEAIVIHRSSIGAVERTMAFLIEKYEGAFPLWLSPIQVSVIPISEKHADYAKEIIKKLKDNNLRVELRDENETLGKKIREAEMQKIPYLLILGDKEISASAVSVRARGKGDDGQMPLEKFIEKIKKEIQEKK